MITVLQSRFELVISTIRICTTGTGLQYSNSKLRITGIPISLQYFHIGTCIPVFYCNTVV